MGTLTQANLALEETKKGLEDKIEAMVDQKKLETIRTDELQTALE